LKVIRLRCIDQVLIISILSGNMGMVIPVSQAREEGGGSDAGFWLSVVGIYSLKTEFSGSPGNS